MLALAFPAGAAEGDALIAAWLGRQTNLQSWSANFTQTRTLKALNQPLVSTGRVWFAAPQNFRWELAGDQTVAIRKDGEMLVVYPRLKRAERYQFGSGNRSDWKDTLALLQSGFPRSRAEFDQQFSVRGVTPMEDQAQLELEPRSAGARKMMPRIQLFLRPNGELAGTELVFMDGSRMRNDFSHSETNAPVEGRFDFVLPADFKVVEPLKERKG